MRRSPESEEEAAGRGPAEVAEVDDPPVDLGSLQRLIARLRAPDGCPWDRQQRLEDLRAYLIEEAHEAAAALDAGDRRALAEELGDLLFQVVFVGRLAAEEGSFRLRDVAEAIHRKMVERHPHVFGDAERPTDAAGVVAAWEKGKKRRRPGSLLAGVPSSLPALTAAYRLTQKAAGVGFDWRSPADVVAKVREELDELIDATEHGGPDDRQVAEELGDLLFAVANLARHLGHDPEAVLARGNAKFRRRFGALEDLMEQRGETLGEVPLEDLDALWEEVKARERSG